MCYYKAQNWNCCTNYSSKHHELLLARFPWHSFPNCWFQCHWFPMHFLLNVANLFHVFLPFITPYFLSSTPSSFPFTTILVFVEIIFYFLFLLSLCKHETFEFMSDTYFIWVHMGRKFDINLIHAKLRMISIFRAMLALRAVFLCNTSSHHVN